MFDDYGPGTHSWPYWARDLRWSIGQVMAEFAHPLPPPPAVTYTSADGQYEIYGWQVAMHRAVREFSTLAGATAGGFRLEGSGSATVTTPALYRRGRVYRVTVGSRSLSVKADGTGRLTFVVPLGPSDTVQEYPLDGPPLGTTVYTTRVTMTG